MTGPRRIAVDLRALVDEPTGIGYYTLGLLRSLVELGSYEYLGLAHREISPEAGEVFIPVEIRPAAFGVLWQQLKLPRRLGAGDIDLFWSPLSILPWRCPVPSVLTVHDLTPSMFPGTHRWKTRLSQLPFLRKSLENAARVVAVSEATARDVERTYPGFEEKLTVVPNGVDEDFVPAEEQSVAEIRDQLRAHDGYLLFAGTLEPRKNVEMIVEVWNDLRQRHKTKLPLVLVGGYGWRSRALLDRIEALAPVGLHYLGRIGRSRLIQLVQGATAFVYPSLYEGFGLPVAEAMACGVPVVTSDRSSLPEVVGDAGVQVDPTDPAALGEAILAVLEDTDLRASLARKGLERSRRFSWPEAARQMEGVFSDALAGR